MPYTHAKQTAQEPMKVMVLCIDNMRALATFGGSELLLAICFYSFSGVNNSLNNRITDSVVSFADFYGVPSGPKFKVRIRYRSFRILVYFHNWSFNFLYFTLLLTIQLLCFVL